MTITPSNPSTGWAACGSDSRHSLDCDTDLDRTGEETTNEILGSKSNRNRLRAGRWKPAGGAARGGGLRRSGGPRPCATAAPAAPAPAAPAPAAPTMAPAQPAPAMQESMLGDETLTLLVANVGATGGWDPTRSGRRRVHEGEQVLQLHAGQRRRRRNAAARSRRKLDP